jgi:transcription-repair coupling factor (superfamily II helicase)
MLLVEYAESARIYLPTGQAHLLTRYVGMGNSAPALHHLKDSAGKTNGLQRSRPLKISPPNCLKHRQRER